MASPGHVPLAETPRQTRVPLPRCSCFAWTPQRPPTNCTAYFLTTSSTFQPPILHIGNPSCIVASFKGQGLGEELLQNTGGNRAFTHKKHVHTESLVWLYPAHFYEHTPCYQQCPGQLMCPSYHAMSWMSPRTAGSGCIMAAPYKKSCPLCPSPLTMGLTDDYLSKLNDSGLKCLFFFFLTEVSYSYEAQR